MNRNQKKIAINVSSERRLPIFCIVVYLLTALSALLYLGFVLSSAFADAFHRTVGAALRTVLALSTAWLPFSVAELLLLLLPLWAVLLILLAARRYCGSRRDAMIFLGILLSILCIVAILFVWVFAAGYYVPPLEDKLGLTRSEVSAAELYQTAEHLRLDLLSLCEQIHFSARGASVMPYAVSEMNEKLMDAYEKFAQENQFLHHSYSRIKPVLLSRAMTYTHITGVYTFFTGEANLNLHFPDYTLPFTAAHELAHQRGISREDEANFIAYLVCMESEDPYLRYSATLSLYEYVLSSLYHADRSLYRQSVASLPDPILAEEAAYDAFFEPYRDNVVADISHAANDAYLQSQGAPQGARSYNLVVDLAVAYYKDKTP